MIINNFSKLVDVLQAIRGTWALSVDDGWRCTEMGELKLFTKLCKAGDNVLPKTFMANRDRVYPYLAFSKSNVGGGVIGVQDQYITLSANALVIVIQC